MKTKSKFIAVMCPLFMMATSGMALAADATGTLIVEATVLNTCEVATTPVSFGQVGLTDVDANGTITVTCTIAAPFVVALDGGGSGEISDRQLSNPAGDTFGYQLYTSANHTAVWGDGDNGDTVPGTGPSQTLTVYGATTSGPTAAGAYSDSVTVTVTY